MPERIQRSRKRGSKLPPNTVCVTRPGRWGNPFKVGEAVRIDIEGIVVGYIPQKPMQCVNLFRAYADWRLENEPDWLAPLRGRNLACWCPVIKDGCYVQCHADVLLALANNMTHDEVRDANLRRATGEEMQ